jgi:hypothetical protein
VEFIELVATVILANDVSDFFILTLATDPLTKRFCE